MTWEKSTLLLIALCEFLIAVDPFLPGYWYSFEGDGFGSLSYLLGVSSRALEVMLQEAGILKSYGNKGDLRFHKDVLYKGFPLLDGLARPNSIVHDKYIGRTTVCTRERCDQSCEAVTSGESEWWRRRR